MAGARGMQASDTLPWRLDASRVGGGMITIVSCHIIDRIDYLFGPLINVEGIAENRNSPYQDVEDNVDLQAEFGPGTWAAATSEDATVECKWNFLSDESVDELVMNGPKKSLRMAAMSPFLPIQVLDKEGRVVSHVKFEAAVLRAATGTRRRGMHFMWR